MTTAHAILAPSASKRWMACPPSARLEAQAPAKETPYTREGTIAHSMAEHLLTLALASKKFAWPENSEELVDKAKTALQSDIVDAVKEDLDAVEMIVTVADNYCRIVWDDFCQARAEYEDAQLLVEQKLNLKEYIPEGFGSADAIIIAGGTLSVYDLKYGKGVKVYADCNTQMMCYALGALCGPGEMYDITSVRMTIIQPRLRWVSTWQQSAASIWGWAKQELRPAAVVAYQGGGDFNPGDHCRFCNVAPRCKALAAKAYEMAAGRQEGVLMTNDEIADALERAATFKGWITSLEAYALEKALEGETFPGFKLVEGRSVRQISDPKAAMQVLEDAGFDKESYCKPTELKTISDLEKLLKKAGFQALLGPYVVKPAGKPTLVADDDPRPAINKAKEDFKEVAL